MATMVLSGPLNVTRTGTMDNQDLPLLQRAMKVDDVDIDGNELTESEKIAATFNEIFRTINKRIKKQREKETQQNDDDIIVVT
jgi:hypothetical protein